MVEYPNMSFLNRTGKQGKKLISHSGVITAWKCIIFEVEDLHNFIDDKIPLKLRNIYKHNPAIAFILLVNG